MNSKKEWFICLFTVLFMLSVSVTVLPCGIVNAHGLFGEITASTITEDKEQVIATIKTQISEKVQMIKGVNIFNIWFELLAMVICICFFAYRIKLSRGDTIVTLKVRMDN